MDQQTPVSSPGGKKRRNLFNEFQGQQEQIIHEPGIPAGAVKGTGEGQWHDGTRIANGNMSFYTLSSGLPSAGLSPGLWCSVGVA